MTKEQRKQFIAEQIEIFPADCEMGEFLRDIEKLQPCEDAISRELILNEITLIAKVKAKSDAQKKLMGRCMFVIEHMPSVNPQKTGRWIEVTDEETLTTRTYHYECSECGTHLKAVEKTRYCSECGALLLVDAKMQEE